jgi:hypothetical protein
MLAGQFIADLRRYGELCASMASRRVRNTTGLHFCLRESAKRPLEAGGIVIEFTGIYLRLRLARPLSAVSARRRILKLPSKFHHLFCTLNRYSQLFANLDGNKYVRGAFCGLPAQMNLIILEPIRRATDIHGSTGVQNKHATFTTSIRVSGSYKKH